MSTLATCLPFHHRPTTPAVVREEQLVEVVEVEAIEEVEEEKRV